MECSYQETDEFYKKTKCNEVASHLCVNLDEISFLHHGKQKHYRQCGIAICQKHSITRKNQNHNMRVCHQCWSCYTKDEKERTEHEIICFFFIMLFFLVIWIFSK